jgi:hypothetical protein
MCGVALIPHPVFTEVGGLSIMLGLLRRRSQVRAKHGAELSRPLSEWAFPSEWEAKALKEAKKV